MAAALLVVVGSTEMPMRGNSAMEEIIVVSGLPRSGTSMMMQMLEAGGMELLTDGVREADRSNPRGYYEYEKVKWLREDNSWVHDARGKVVKVVAPLLRNLPGEFVYRVIFMLRDSVEVLASQRVMLGIVADRGDAWREIERHVESAKEWLALQENFSVIFVRYDEAVASPHQCASAVNQFLGGGLDEVAMAGAVDAALYRQGQPE